MCLIPLPEKIMKWWPDTLHPYFLNHIGRHGARLLSSEHKVTELEKFLLEQDKIGNLSAQGKAAMALIDTVRFRSNGRWGALTQTGREEEIRIANLTYRLCPELFEKGIISSISSYTPRVVESQYSFCLEMSNLSSYLQILTDEGRNNDELLRPFTYFKRYSEFRDRGEWKKDYEKEVAVRAPYAPIIKLLKDASALSKEDAQKLSLEFYGILQGMESSMIECNPSAWFTIGEYSECAKLSNLQRYLRNSASRYSDLAPQSVIPLLENILKAGNGGERKYTANLRFGHDETLMPLLSLMDICGGYQPNLPIDAEKVWENWNTSELFPLAANLQIIYLQSESGRDYVAVMYNEIPTYPFRDAPSMIVPMEDFQKSMRERIELFK
ncbi:MAG: histidine phosphatase family protein [Prevotella sp.]|nr:histidine phosphatase family protein [Bacteroides sp.]MCM1366995.1 histidine phosphatase family protein [Prevotella sp.]MCM1437504.1 histidine phosphatase family protein [Prevotella sp.]